MVAAAAEAAGTGAGAGRERPLLLAITVLTHLDAAAAAKVWPGSAVADQVRRLAGLARAAGADGVVASAAEAVALREAFGDELVLLVPGIRPPLGCRSARPAPRRHSRRSRAPGSELSGDRQGDHEPPGPAGGGPPHPRRNGSLNRPRGQRSLATRFAAFSWSRRRRKNRGGRGASAVPDCHPRAAVTIPRPRIGWARFRPSSSPAELGIAPASLRKAGNPMTAVPLAPGDREVAGARRWPAGGGRRCSPAEVPRLTKVESDAGGIALTAGYGFR